MIGNSRDVLFASATNVTCASAAAFGAPHSSLDIDGDGRTTALSDGLMIVRAMLGMNGTAVTGGLVGATATRPTWPQIRAHLSTSCGLQGLAP
jgi:hypothetical protein